MLQRALLAILLLLALPIVASATPVTVTVEPWKTVDGNFAFSVIHAASGGRMAMDGLEFYAGGSLEYTFSQPTQSLTGDLTGDVLSLNAGKLALDGGSIFSVQASVLDFGTATGELIGSLGYELMDAKTGDVEVGSFYFYNFDYTNGACDANGLCADGEYRLWGNNWDAADGPRASIKDNVVVNGDRTTRLRGIDLGGSVAPVPEPSSALLFLAGALVAGGGVRRRQPR